MSTISRRLPGRPHLDVPKREARELLDAWRAGEAQALDRIRSRHPKYRGATDASLKRAPFKLADAQHVIAGEYGLEKWSVLKQKIESHALTEPLRNAIQADDRNEVVRILRAHPHLLHLPVWSGNWGPPMSHAANLGRLEIVQAVAALGARDFQHAFDRALLQGQIPTARWLREQGAQVAPDSIMGPCETLDPDGLRFLLELGTPVTDPQGNRLAPLALALETYAREPTGKHAVLELLAPHYAFPDTPIMAVHRGQLARLAAFLQSDPRLIERRFTAQEIYPPELGCADDGRNGLCGTPLNGVTLLHLAIDFDELEIFDLLLTHGADPNARATVDDAGFGGHAPLFHTVVNCGKPGRHQHAMAKTLLARGASKDARASVRKFLDWREQPAWHEAQNVTAAEWARDFPERGWVNRQAVDELS